MRVFETEDYGQIREISQALSGRGRMEIVKLLSTGAYNINEISAALGMPLPTVTVNTRQLEQAGIISIIPRPGKRGVQKICRLKYSEFRFNIDKASVAEPGGEIIEMPIGNFVDAKPHPPCGICTSEQRIGRRDDERVFFSPERIGAQLIWFTRGSIEYRFSNPFYEEKKVGRINLSAEICTEVPYFNNKAQSAVSLEINGRTLPLWISPGDFGGKRGGLTPKWWGIHKTQYGVLVDWDISEGGVICSGKKTAGGSISDFGIDRSPFISVVFSVDEKSGYKGGINLFGKGFGNYQQDIILQIEPAL